MVALFATVGFACETVDEDERFIGPIENGTPQDSITDDSIIVIKKNVLIEDFTGQRCKNCPNATYTIKNLQNAYGKDRIIPVAIHGGQLSLPAPKGLANTESKAYHTMWSVNSWPKGMVNRVGGLLEYTAWSATVLNELNEKAIVDLKADKSTYNAESNTISVNVELTATEDVEATLQVWLIESGITAYQSMPDGTSQKDYEHNHVFRATANGMEGEKVNLTEKETITKQYEYTISDNKWKPENMAIVTFVTNSSGVLQVIETPIAK